MYFHGKTLSLSTRGAMLHASECCVPGMNDIAKFKRNEQAMLKWICCLKPHDSTSIAATHTKL